MPQHEGPRIQLSAYEDLAAIYDRCRRGAGDQSAERVSERLLNGIGLLGVTPYLGPLHHDPVLARQGYRKLVIDGYVVVYRVIDGVATVYRVFHGASDYTRCVE